MAFTIEFQPIGKRIQCESPLYLLDASRQAGITLTAVCGGEGTCGKCMVQVMETHAALPVSEADRTHLTKEQLEAGYRLACTAVISANCKILIPNASLISDQVLQLEGIDREVKPQPAVRQIQISPQPPSLTDLKSDLSRVYGQLNLPSLKTGISTIRNLPFVLRENDWHCTVWTRGDKIIHAARKLDEQPFGLAVDVGSTKIAAYLVDLTTGRTLTAKGVPNPQIAYGEDIMARLGYAIANQDQAKTLFDLTIQAINEAAETMCARIGRSPQEIRDICLVGNTAMHHIFLDLPVGGLAVSPFVPVVSDPLYPQAESLGIHAMPGAGVYAPPVKAGFIGSDHLAFLHAAGFGRDTCTRLGIDIGTNTEIALQTGGRIVSVSTASGPAFEGAHIKYGMRAAPGAIEYVRIDADGQADIDVIGNTAPTGICGSGILDTVAQLRLRGFLNKRGRLIKDAPGVQLDDDGKPFFTLSGQPNPVTISQQDIDQILLAKGAIRAGIDVLMDHLQVRAEDIAEIVIAGAFGSYLLPEHAIGIGMLPDVPLDRIKAIGNAAGAGARMMLISTGERAKAEALADQIEYLELTVYPDFPIFYAQGIRA